MLDDLSLYFELVTELRTTDDPLIPFAILHAQLPDLADATESHYLKEAIDAFLEEHGGGRLTFGLPSDNT